MTADQPCRLVVLFQRVSEGMPMSRDEHYSPFAPAPDSRISRGELLYEVPAGAHADPLRVG